jgi:histone H3/H4
VLVGDLQKQFLIVKYKMMKTGFGESTGEFESSLMNTAINLIQPVLETAMIVAAQYSKACGRDCILSKDMEYAMKYCVMYKVGEHIGSHFPEIYDESDTDSEEDFEVVEETPDMFTRYVGTDVTFLKINTAYDNWNTWIPQNPTEELLKNAINSNELI